MAGRTPARNPDRPPPSVRRRPTLQDIAEAAGVSPGLVSLVLRGRAGPGAASAATVVEIAGQPVPRRDRRADPLLSRTHGRDYEVLLPAVTPTVNERSAVETLVDSRCEGVILLNSALPPETLEARAPPPLDTSRVGMTVRSRSARPVRTSSRPGA